jgi:signal transduction histidine kinase
MNLLTITSSNNSTIDVSSNLKFDGDAEVITKRVDSFDDLEHAIQSQSWHAIFCNCHTPGFSSIDDLIRLKKITNKVPIFVLSESSTETQNIQIMEVGIDDFVINSHTDTLSSVLKGLIDQFYQDELSTTNFLIEKKAFAAKEQMLSLVYHDIKNPVSAIQLDAQMLEVIAQKEIYPEMLSDIKIQARRIIRTVNRIKKLISDLLERHSGNIGLEKSFVIHKQFHDPLVLINEVLETFGPLLDDKKIKLIKSFASISIRAFFDKDRLSQVISNLLSNAIKFTPQGKSILLSLDLGIDKDCIFTIEDTGTGIKEEFLPYVFDKYWTDGTGHGLGLFICKEIIEAHGGTIHVSSALGKGARFTFSIPPFDHDADSLMTENEKFSFNVNQENLIFVIDDDDDLREVISWALTKESYNVVSFSNPFKAIEVLSHLIQAPKLIILDFNLVEMTGEDFLKIKVESDNSFFRDCPVLMISAASHEILDNLDPKLYQEMLVKPVDLKKLLNTVNINAHP